MNEREGGQGRDKDPRMGQGARQGQYEPADQGAMTQQQPTSSIERQQGSWEDREAGGGWSGYVVPYRYYGPGYRGVGYYSVMYQGRDQAEAEDEPQEQFGQRGGRGGQAGGRWVGGYAGRGPKGYKRSDDRIVEEISDRLMADDRIDASDIEVTAHGGEVTLTGTVEERWAKRRAEDIAEQVMGVRDVMNQIRVQSGSRESQGTRTGTPASRGGSAPSSRKQAGASTGRSGDGQSTGANGRRQTTATR